MLVTETFDYDGGRQVTVYVPPAPPQVVVFAGDGQVIAHWGQELEAANVPPAMIVGVHCTDDTDEMARLREYSPGFDPERFGAHEHFVLNDVQEWVRSRFGVFAASRTIVGGASAGAEFALAMGMRHPRIFGTVFAASPGAGYRPPSPMPETLPGVYLAAGTLEPFFLDNTARWAHALQAAGAEVVFSEQHGNHGDAFWRTEFAKMIPWSLR